MISPKLEDIICLLNFRPLTQPIDLNPSSHFKQHSCTNSIQGASSTIRIEQKKAEDKPEGEWGETAM